MASVDKTHEPLPLNYSHPNIPTPSPSSTATVASRVFEKEHALLEVRRLELEKQHKEDLSCGLASLGTGGACALMPLIPCVVQLVPAVPMISPFGAFFFLIYGIQATVRGAAGMYGPCVQVDISQKDTCPNCKCTCCPQDSTPLN